jgi:hypothetical protein
MILENLRIWILPNFSEFQIFPQFIKTLKCLNCRNNPNSGISKISEITILQFRIMDIFWDFFIISNIRNNLNFLMTSNSYNYCVFRHYPSSCLYLKTVLFIITKHNVSETGFCLRLQGKPTQTYGDRIQSPKRYFRNNKTGWFLDNDKTMDNVQKHNTCINVPSSQTFRSNS